MNRKSSLWTIVAMVAALALAGCHTDPNVRKQKYLESGKRYSSEGKYREAVIQFANAIKIDKGYGDAHYELAQAYVHLRQFNQAYVELARTVELEPGNLKARIDLGNLLLAGGNGNIDKAQEQANAVMKVQPDNPDVHALLAAIALRRGQRDQALAEMNRALALDPNRAAFHEDYALLESGDSSKASSVEDELKKSVALDPKSVNAKLLLSAYYMRGGRWADAEKASRDAIATDPKSLQARESLAQVFLRQNNPQKAEEVLRQASHDLSDNPQGASILAEYYAGSGQLEKARTEYAALIAKTPKSYSFRKGYIRVLLQLRDFGTARAAVAGLIKDDPKDPEADALNGIVLLNDGKARDAVLALQNGAKDFPKDAFIQYWLGKAALATGDSSLAEKSFIQAVQLRPTEIAAQEELARIATQRGDMNLLADVADKTVAAAPRFPGGYVWRSIVEISRQQNDRAEADLKSAIAIAPQSPQAYLEFGKLRFVQKRFPEGVSLFEQALQYDPNSVEALRMLVDYDLYQKQTDKAIARVNEQIARSPKNSGFLDFLAQLQMQQKKLDLAAATAQKAIQLNSGDGEAVMLYAQIQVQRGQTNAAIAAWQQWASAHPNDAGAYALLGTLEEANEDLDKAEQYYKKALEIQPKQPLASNNLAYRMLLNGENVDVALSLAQTARQAMPNSPNTADTLAWAYYYKGTYSFARDLLENAIKNDPNNASMQYHLGMVYSKLRDKSSAELHLKKAILLDPNSHTGQDARAALNGLG